MLPYPLIAMKWSPSSPTSTLALLRPPRQNFSFGRMGAASLILSFIWSLSGLSKDLNNFKNSVKTLTSC